MPSAQKPRASGRILIVDDNDLGLIVRKGVLSELGHEIVTCSAPLEALALCSQQNFDLVVTDYKMPSIDGIELIQRLRAANQTMPIILLSGFTDALGLSEANTGASAVIQKSSNEVAHLQRCVNRLLKPARKPAASQGGARFLLKKKADC